MKLNFNNVYAQLPVIFQNFAISLFGYYWKKRRFGGIFKDQLSFFKNRELFSQQQWVDYQTLQLRLLLTHALSTVPFYREKYSCLGITIDDVQKFELSELNSLPILTKNELRQYGTSSLLSKNREKGGSFFGSSGTTGTPVQILYSHHFHQRVNATMQARVRNWAGLTSEDPRGMIGGRRVLSDAQNKPPFFRYNYFEKQTYFSAYHISSKNAKDYVSAINKYKPLYMTGYAMSNYILARFIEQNNLNVQPLKSVITSSEKLTQEMRDTFKRVYGCKTYDSYSGVEACSLISECEFGKLHVSPDVGYIEFIKEDGSYAQLGESGEMVCTGFLNYDQPLIRYRIGDIAKISLNQSCDCGRNMLIIDELVGRTEDVVTGFDGRKMVRFHGIFIGISSIIEGQIIQHTLMQFEIKLVISQPLTNEEEKKIYKRMESQLGKIELTINVVDFIPRTKVGKFKAVISYVNN